MVLKLEDAAKVYVKKISRGCSTPLKRKIDSLWIASQ